MANDSPDDVLCAVEARRAAGASVSEACRQAGISASTYYRRRRQKPDGVDLMSSTPCSFAEGAKEDASVLPPQPATPITTLATVAPKERPTTTAPQFWDGVFKDELSDSYVRRALGRQKRPLAILPRRPARLSARTYNALGSLFGGIGVGLMSIVCGGIASFFRERPYSPPEDGWRLAAGPAFVAGLLVLGLIASCAFLLIMNAADPAGWAKTTVAPEVLRVAAGR